MQSTKSILTLASIAALTAGLTGCASGPYYGANTYPAGPTTTVTTVASVQPAGVVEYGRITDVSLVSGTSGTSRANSTTGTIVGAVVGGALGNLVGGGTGRVVATVLGAAGGAVVGNRLANNDGQLRAMNGPIYRLTVTTDQGNYRQYDVTAASDLRVGDRVRIENGTIYQG
ncbi:glycine zipper 2TM domain-containing protein [Caenimonas koreensis]|nr:glycine zipper 2TM domain-containing protein [Caenimonas koreensis]